MTPTQRDALGAAANAAGSVEGTSRLANQYGTELARWAIEQTELRQRARGKFARGSEMLFVREALEQSTHEAVAAYHASAFPPGETVVDLTAGIGADAIALAKRGPLVAFELDAARAECLEENLSVYGCNAEIRVEDSVAWLESMSPPDRPRYAFADPARRTEGRRTRSPEDFTPDPRRLAKLHGNAQRFGMKLSPMLADEYLESLGSCLEFVSYGGECREALVWLGSEVSAGRWAVHVGSGERLASQPLAETTDEPEAFFFDADPAAVRAHALGAFGLSGLGDSNGYLTSASRCSSPWLRGYRVLYHGRGDMKETRRQLDALGSATPELKQRGAGLDLTKLRQSLKLRGTRKLSLAIWPVGKSLRHTILEPISRTVPSP